MKLLFAFLFSVVSLPLFAAEYGGFKFSGLAFGDYYWFATDHIEDIEGQNGFWFRRIYFTVDKDLGDSFDVRFRLEMNSPGDFSDSLKLEPFVKDIYVRWKNPTTQVLLGLSPTPTWELIEPFWGYRSLEKTAVDLHAMAPARDMGIAVRWASGKTKIAFNFGNGAGDRSELDQGKAVSGSVQYQFSDAIVSEFYADYNALPDDLDRYTFQGFIGYSKPSGRVGVQYVHQELDQSDQKRNIDLLSVFGVYKINEKWNLVGRCDRMFDPDPNGPTIPYIPFAGNSRSTFFLAAVDYSIHKYVSLSPNVEIVTYDHPVSGETPNTDIIPRFTFYFHY